MEHRRAVFLHPLASYRPVDRVPPGFWEEAFYPLSVAPSPATSSDSPPPLARDLDPFTSVDFNRHEEHGPRPEGPTSPAIPGYRLYPGRSSSSSCSSSCSHPSQYPSSRTSYDFSSPEPVLIKQEPVTQAPSLALPPATPPTPPSFYEECFFCPWPACGKSYKRKSDLKFHVVDKHPDLRQWANDNLSGTRARDNKAYSCPEPGCASGFVRKSDLRRHLRTKHDPDALNRLKAAGNYY